MTAKNTNLTRFFLKLEPFLPQVPVGLEVHPQFCRCFEIRTKPQSGFWADSSFASANFIDHSVGGSYLTREFPLRKVHGLQKFFFKNFSWVNGVLHAWLWKFHLKNVPLTLGGLRREFVVHWALPRDTSLPHNSLVRFCRRSWLVGLFFLTPGCVSRAPTDCELDKRSGLYPSSFCEGKTEKSTVKPTKSALATYAKPNEIPVRSGPLIKKVWISDQTLEGGHWLQGTWVYIEVEPSRWVGKTISSAKPGGNP